MSNVAAEMKELLKKFNKGVKDVTVDYGIMYVYVTSKKTAIGVMTDLRLSGAFQSIKPTEWGMRGSGYIIHTVPR